MANSPETTINLAPGSAASANTRNGAARPRDPNEPVAVVGLGASAGGVAVLQQFFDGMVPDSGLAFVVIMHLAPDYQSNLAGIIQAKTSMPVIQVNEPVKVQPNHVYVIPPSKQLIIEDARLCLIEAQQALGRRVTIDLFFRTLAQSYGQRSVGVILSGGDSDGVIGLKHIRAQGGVTMAQDPQEAEHDSMPLSAINTGMVDWVLPVAEMPGKLVEFVCNERRMQLPPEMPEAKEPDAKVRDAPGGEIVSEETCDPAHEAALHDVLGYLRAQTGQDFTHYKRATVLRRVARRLQVNSLESIPEYLEFLRRHPSEARALLHDLLIGVTHFFRDPESFAALQANVPQLFAGKKRDEPIRVWVGGCATGEEAYSIAMLLCEHAAKLEAPPPIQLFASDIDEQAIHEARYGAYPSTIEADVSPERLKRFFTREQGHYRVKKEVREKVLFAAHNLLSDAPFSRLDLVSCRNLLIYLTPKAQEQVFDIFHFALRVGGLLFIGGSETGEHAHALFSPVDPKHRVYVRRSVPRPSWKIPMLPLRAPNPFSRVAVGPRPRVLAPLIRGIVEEAATDTSESAFAGQERRSVLFGELHLKLLEQYGPPSVVVNDGHDILHLSEHAGRYLHFVAGEPSANLIKVIHPSLRIELRTALFRAAQTNENVTAFGQTIELDGTTEVINLHVRPIHPRAAERGFYLVLFEKQSGAVAAAEPGPARQAAVNQQMDDEIQLLKGQLNTTVEQYEASNEELKASNEELQAMNEEMRSATEELETSKEELESVNEELTTVNHELKNSVEELSRANTDLQSLMASTDIGTLFLDRELRIKRFTPSAQRIFNLLASDIGRPLSDITHKLDYENLIKEAEKAFDDLTTVEREVRSGDRWFVARFAPYRAANDRVAGLVGTFIDITRRKRAEDEWREGELRYRTLFDLVPVAVYTCDAAGVIQEFNRRAVKLWGRTPEKNTEKFCGSVKMFHPDGTAMPHEECPMARVLRGEELDPGELEVMVEKADGARRSVVVNPSVLKNKRGEIIGAINCIHDITDRKKATEGLRESEERFRQFAENSADVFWIVNAKTQRLEYLNPIYEQMWGEPRQALMADSKHWLELIHPEDRERASRAMPRALAGETFVIEYRIVRSADGEVRWIRDTGFPIRDQEGSIYRVAGVAQDVTEDKNRAEALRGSEERFRLLVEGARDYAMFLLDPANIITFWSGGAERVFGWTQEEAVGRSGELIFTPEDRARGEVAKEIGISLRDGRAADRRYHLRKDGSRFWADGVLMRLDGEEAGPRGFAKIARDATDDRRSEDALRHARDELEQRVVERTADMMQANAALQDEIKTRQQLERELLGISERERRRIGQDLHDVVCQELSATALFLKSSVKKVKDETAARTLDQAAHVVNRNVTLARNLARGFQPVELEIGGLNEALRSLCTQINANPQISCEFKLLRSARIANETIALNLYRIAQEAVGNAVKHSGATEIVVCFERERGRARLVIEDNGKGIRTRKRSKGLGLHIMKYRANVLGGSLTIDPKPKGGTRITCVVPLKK